MSNYTCDQRQEQLYLRPEIKHRFCLHGRQSILREFVVTQSSEVERVQQSADKNHRQQGAE